MPIHSLRRLRAPSTVEWGMLAAVFVLGVLGCSHGGEGLRSAKYDPLVLFEDDSLRHELIKACHQGTPQEVTHYTQLPACELAAHEESLKRSGWKPIEPRRSRL